MNYYWDENLMKNDGKLPSILAIGDSWFWYPLPGGSLINYIGPVVEKKVPRHPGQRHERGRGV